MPKPPIEERCALTDLPKDWCAHCRRKTLTEEEQETKDFDNLIKRWSNG